VIKSAKLAGRDFLVPGRKKVGGALLDLNYKSFQLANKKTLLSDATTFGLVLLGGGATIHHIPLINCLALCRDCPHVVLSINDCTEHLQEGEKKMHLILHRSLRLICWCWAHTKHLSIYSSLMGLQMYKRLADFYQ